MNSRRRPLKLVGGKLTTAATPPSHADVKYVARLLSVPRITVYDWLRRGLLRPIRVRGQQKVSLKSLARFLARVESGELRVRAKLPHVVNENPPRGVRVRRVAPNALWGFDAHGRPWLIG